MIKDKLSTQSLRSFADCVDLKYHNAFREHYCTFQYTPADIIPPTDINRLYEQMKHDFPITHFVISTIVSNTKTIIEVNEIFSNGVLAIDELSDDNDDMAPPLREPDNNDPNSGKSDDEDDTEPECLNNKERCVLEYFIALICVKSQKLLRYWSMLIPLAYHSCGFQQPGKKTHLNAHTSTLKTVWANLGKLYDECEMDRMAVIGSHHSVSGAFDNWQYSAEKNYQSGGINQAFSKRPQLCS
jgi:hypothetical protein